LHLRCRTAKPLRGFAAAVLGVSFHSDMRMRKIRVLLVVLTAVQLLASCSTTPGDAAHRGGHYEQAADLYRRGAEQGDASAALKLGLLVDAGEANSEMFGSSGLWFIRACDLGDNTGCHNAGVGFEYGREGSAGLDKNLNKARDYYLRAAERGYMQSQYNLGSLYANQYFADDIEGLKWLLLSQKNAQSCVSTPLCKWVLNDPPGHIKQLRQRMSAVDVVRAERMMSEWVAK
jgi:hypothetical protein